MGISGCAPKKVLWIGSKLTLSSLKHLDLGNKIDVDGNALAWKLGAGKSIHEVVHLMSVHLKEIAHSGGFVITVVIDGDGRPDCKRDSWNRKKQRDLDDMNRMYCRLKALELNAKSDNGDMNIEDRSNLDLYMKEASSLEKKVQRSLVLPTDFGQRLSDKLMMINACLANENGGFVQEHILKAKFQADSVIARRAIEKQNDFILSEDTDFAALLGPDCILIKNIQYKKGQSSKTRGRKKKSAGGNATHTRCPTSFEVSIVGPCNTQMNGLRQKIEERDGALVSNLALLGIPQNTLYFHTRIHHYVH